MSGWRVEGAGGLAESLRTAAAGEGCRACVIVAADLSALDQARTAAAAEEAVMVVLPATLASLDGAMLSAAIRPLAIDAAPASRVSAVRVGDDADPLDVAATVRFLIDARSTTGQLLTVGRRADQ